MHRTIKRWIYSPLGQQGVPLVAANCIQWRIPCAPPAGQPALVLCEMLPGGLAAAKQNAELAVLPSRHSAEAIPAAVATGLKALGSRVGMTTHELLELLSSQSAEYEPDE